MGVCVEYFGVGSGLSVCVALWGWCFDVVAVWVCDGFGLWCFSGLGWVSVELDLRVAVFGWGRYLCRALCLGSGCLGCFGFGFWV